MRYIFILLVLISVSFTSLAQRNKDESVVYEKIYDEPYDVYKLWIKFQPVYFDLFMSNVNAGFGFEAEYIEYEKFDLRLAMRMPYSSTTDLNRAAGDFNNEFSDEMRSAMFFELGGSYHIYDDVKDGIAKIVLRRKAKSSKARNRQKIKGVEFIKVGAKVREIVGIRAGFKYYNTSINVSDAAIRQGLTSINGNKNTVYTNFYRDRLYGDLTATGFYLGGSYSQFRNLVIKPEGYSNLGNDILITTFADILIMPSINLAQASLALQDEEFDLNNVKTNPFGFRVGLEGKFNQAFTYSYTIETGIRPGLSKRGFYALFKVCFPVLATSLKMEKESFESVGN